MTAATFDYDGVSCAFRDEPTIDYVTVAAVDDGAASVEFAVLTAFIACIAAALFVFVHAGMNVWVEDVTPQLCERGEVPSVVGCVSPRVAELVDGGRVSDNFRVFSN